MNRRKPPPLLLINLLGLALAVACSGSLSSPLEPTGSDSFNSSASGTATIQGRASTGASTASMRTTAGSSTAIKVCVTGTSNCDAIDANGQFELKGNFSGNVDLTFTSPLGTSTATIENVVVGETVVVAVSIAGGTATLKIESRTGNGDSADDESADDVSDDVSDDESGDDESEDDESEDDDSEDSEDDDSDDDSDDESEDDDSEDDDTGNSGSGKQGRR